MARYHIATHASCGVAVGGHIARYHTCLRDEGLCLCVPAACSSVLVSCWRVLSWFEEVGTALDVKAFGLQLIERSVTGG